MFDALFAAPEFSAKTTETRNAPPPTEIPAAAAAGASQAEGVRAFDEVFQQDAAPGGQRAQDGVPESKAEGAEDNKPAAYTTGTDKQEITTGQPAVQPVSGAEAVQAFDEFLFARDIAAPGTAQIEADIAAQPAPFSEAAWEDESLPSMEEPQAEGMLFTGGQPVSTEAEKVLTVSLDEALRAIDAALACHTGATAAAALPKANTQPMPEPPEKFEAPTAPAPAAEQKEETAEPPAPGPVSEEEAEHAFDDFIKHQADAFSAAEAPAVFQPVPYSEAAWNQSSFTGGQEAAGGRKPLPARRAGRQAARKGGSVGFRRYHARDQRPARGVRRPNARRN